MHYMQGSNVTTLVFVCVRVVTAGCDRAIRMHQDGLTLSPSSYIHRSPPSAFSFSFSSPPLLPFISFPTLCSSFHSCFVLFFPHLFISPLLQYIPSLLFSFSFMSLPSSYLSPLLRTSSILLSTPLFLLSIIYLPPTPHSLRACYLISHLFLFSPYPSPPSSSPCFPPSSVETSKEFWEQQQGQNLHLDISVSCSSGGGDGWRVAGAAALPWVTVVITDRDGYSLATSSQWLVGKEAREEREKEERGRKTEREVRKTQLEESAGKGSGGLLWQEQGTKSSEGQILVC